MTQIAGGTGGVAAQRGAAARRQRGLRLERVYTAPGVHPYDAVTWERRDVVMTNWRDGTENFRQQGVEFPDFWTVNAANIVTTKYFPRRGQLAAARVEPSPADRPGCADLPQGGRGARLLRGAGGRRGLRARADAHAVASGVQLQLTGLVQRRNARPAAKSRRASRTTLSSARRPASCRSASS